MSQTAVCRRPSLTHSASKRRRKELISETFETVEAAEFRSAALLIIQRQQDAIKRLEQSVFELQQEKQSRTIVEESWKSKPCAYIA